MMEQRSLRFRRHRNGDTHMVRIDHVSILSMTEFIQVQLHIRSKYLFILKSYDILLRNPPKYCALSLDQGPFRDFDLYQTIKRQHF